MLTLKYIDQLDASVQKPKPDSAMAHLVPNMKAIKIHE